MRRLYGVADAERAEGVFEWLREPTVAGEEETDLCGSAEAEEETRSAVNNKNFLGNAQNIHSKGYGRTGKILINQRV